MNNFDVTSSKFYNELRNGSTFADNLTDFTDTLVGNVGENIQLIRTIEVSTEIIADDFGGFTYDSTGTYGTFTFTGNWFTEGLSVGATVDVFWDGNVAEETLYLVTGGGGSTLKMTKTNLDLAGLTDGTRTDFIIKVKSVADRVTYKYALNQLSATSNNYLSPFDSNEQAYYLNGITGAYQTLQRIGGDVSWDLGTVEIKFNPTGSDYIHEYEIRHTFKIPFFKDGELNNIDNLLLPTNLASGNTLKYGYGLFMAETNTNYNRILEDAGFSGSVGYYNENFNGFSNDYEVQTLDISNSYSNQTLEGTVTNTVTFQLKNNNGNFITGQEIVFKHSKLPTFSEYGNKTNTFDVIWLIDSLHTTVDAVSSDSSIITNCTVALNVDNSLLDVSFDISYDATQQLLIEDTKNWLLSTIIDNNTLDANITNRVNLKIDSQLWSYDNDVYDLLRNTDLLFVDSSQDIFIDGSKGWSNFTGWNADFMGAYFTFETDISKGTLVRKAIFKTIAFKNDIEQFVISSVPINLGLILLNTNITTGVTHQNCNVDYQNSFNITPNESFNRIKLDSSSPVGDWQTWVGSLAFEVKWQEWIANSNVASVFYDASETNNNLNLRTSNYSDVNDYDIYGVLDLELMSEGGLITDYRLITDISEELDFDVSGTYSFTGTTFIYDSNGDPTDNIYSNQDTRIEIEFDHSLLLLLGLGGEIFIEKENSTAKPWRLSTVKDWSNPLNPLCPSDTLSTGNTTLVEVVSVSNKVTLICNTNHLNLDPNTNYNIYGRIFDI